jgi:hypothetical protein
MASCEAISKAFHVYALHTLQPFPDTAHPVYPDIRVIGETARDFVVQRLVEIVSIDMESTTHVLDIGALLHLLCESGHLFFQHSNPFFSHTLQNPRTDHAPRPQTRPCPLFLARQLRGALDTAAMEFGTSGSGVESSKSKWPRETFDVPRRIPVPPIAWANERGLERR